MKTQKTVDFVDWTKYTLDELVKILENKHRFSSTGESYAIFKLIEFYKKNRPI